MSFQSYSNKLLFLILFFSVFILSFVSAGELKVTQEHPFLINGTWIDASELKVGDELTLANGSKVTITKLTDVVENESFPVYNLEAGEYHNFVVCGDDECDEDSVGVVVHNSNGEIVNPVAFFSPTKIPPSSKEISVMHITGAKKALSINKYGFLQRVSRSTFSQKPVNSQLYDGEVILVLKVPENYLTTKVGGGSMTSSGFYGISSVADKAVALPPDIAKIDLAGSGELSNALNLGSLRRISPNYIDAEATIKLNLGYKKASGNLQEWATPELRSFFRAIDPTKKFLPLYKEIAN